jgi:[acyl-carrier-protein] S-malonyltransferase
MGKDLAGKFTAARLRYQEAADVLGFDLAQICFEGPEDALRQTRVTQPALYVHSCILADLLAQREIRPSAAAGHSLGEYSALYAAGVFSFADGLRLVKTRAEAMQQAGQVNPGTMAAIVGMEDEAVVKLCQELSDGEVVVPANYNSPGQLVVSGHVAAVRSAVSEAKTRGARLARELPVSGAFHSPLMKPAAEALAAALQTAVLKLPRIPVVSNVTAKPYTEVETLRRLLAEQLLSPVRWTDSIMELARALEPQWLEVGSGNVLAGLLKRVLPGATALTVGCAADLDKFAERMDA